MAERDEDFFDFSEQILGEPAKELVLPSGEISEDHLKPNPYQSEVQTSYLLVNALLNLLVRKGIIFQHEVQSIVAELHIDYMKRKRGSSS
jgi:hypothetical protein